MFFSLYYIYPLFFAYSCFVPLLQAQPLNIYTYQSFNSNSGPGEALQKKFEAMSDCKIEWYESEDAVLLLNRLKMEGKQSQADIILGLDTQLLNAAEQANLVQSHHLKKPQNSTLNWWDDDFIPFDFGELTLIYDASKINNPPHNWSEFLKHPKWTLIYSDPRTSTPGLGFLLWIKAIYGEDAFDVWRQIAKKTVTIPSSWSDAYQLFLHGEADFVLSYNTSPIVHQLYEQNNNYRAVQFEEGSYPQIELAAIAKNAPNIDCAKQFISYLITDEAQYEIATKNIMLPVINIDLPSAFKIIKPQSNNFLDNPTTSSKSRSNLVKEWRQAVTQ